MNKALAVTVLIAIAHVLEPPGDGKFSVLAELAPGDWRRLAKLAQRM